MGTRPAAGQPDVLVFCDADVLLAPGALDACWRQLCAQRADVFSVFPRQRTATAGERLLVPLIDEVLLAFLPHPCSGCLLRPLRPRTDSC